MEEVTLIDNKNSISRNLRSIQAGHQREIYPD
jgi:antitoxin (DNA-binding transcriptional repressor) of toxin-antitoxin stability system